MDLDGTGKKKDADGKPELTETDKEFKPLTDYLAERFKEDIKTVRLSSRLTDSASCLVADEYGYSAHMERVLKAFNEDVPKTLRIMELNPNHPVTRKMLELASSDTSSESLADYSDILFAQARLAEGTPLENPSRFNKLVSKLMVM